jgi:hypothetical protein
MIILVSYQSTTATSLFPSREYSVTFELKTSEGFGREMVSETVS